MIRSPLRRRRGAAPNTERRGENMGLSLTDLVVQSQ